MGFITTMVIIIQCFNVSIGSNERSKMKKKIYEFGYDRDADGNLVVNEKEAEIIKLIFDHLIKYTEHPPKELVDAVIEEAENDYQTITYEEAEKKVSYDYIVGYIIDEANKKLNKS